MARIELCLTNLQGQAVSRSRNKERASVCVVSVSQNGEKESVVSGSQNVRERERECVCAVSVSQNGENEFLEDESIYRQSLS